MVLKGGYLKLNLYQENLHADAHDFDSHTTDLEDISRKIFSAHFGQLAVIEIWLSGMFFGRA